MEHLRAVLRSLRVAGLTANPRKCAIGRVEVRYLGFHLGHGQVRPQIDKMAAVAACPSLKTKKEVRQFLGLAGYYRRFIPNFADLTSPLTDLTKKEAPDPVQWTELCQQALTLRYYLLGREFTLCSDHAPLQWLHRMKDTNARITRWYLALQPFKFKVIHRPGVQMAVADFLSRNGRRGAAGRRAPRPETGGGGMWRGGRGKATRARGRAGSETSGGMEGK